MLFLPVGGGDHQDNEGLHQHDGEETLQHHVSDQRRQFMGQVIGTFPPESTFSAVAREVPQLRVVSLDGGSRTNST